MENLTKALLIAAGMLLIVLIVSLLVVGYNQISSYYEQKQGLLTAEQLEKFNREFENYNRGDIRGNELISLMNKVIDYNVSQSYQEETNYKPIQVEIKIGDEFVNSFRYEEDATGTNIIDSVIKNTISNVNNQANDKRLVAIASTPHDLIEKADEANIKLNDTQLQKLTMEISNILINEDETDNSSNEYRRLRAISLKKILKLNIGTTSENEIRLNSTTFKTESGGEKIATIKDIVSQYYQYTQFKRAYFKCTEIRHDAGTTGTGRVVGMKFEVQTKDQNGNTVVQFD